MNMQDFYTGHAFDAYEFFGAHTYFGGTHFAVWAPSAQHIAVETEIGTFDLHRTQSAVWECDAPGVQAGMVYQYWVRGANGQSVAHCDPYGTAMTLRPDGRSIDSDAPKGFADDVRDLFRRPVVEIVKRSKRGEKTVNMRELMRDLTVTDGLDEVTAVVTTAAGNNNMSPEYLTRAIRQYLPQYEIPFSAYHRMNVFTSDGTPFR